MADRTELWNQLEGRVERLEAAIDGIPRTPSALGVDEGGGSVTSVVNAKIGSPFTLGTSVAALQYDTEDHDELGEYDTGTYRFTATNAGKYLVCIDTTYFIDVTYQTFISHGVRFGAAASLNYRNVFWRQAAAGKVDYPVVNFSINVNISAGHVIEPAAYKGGHASAWVQAQSTSNFLVFGPVI